MIGPVTTPYPPDDSEQTPAWPVAGRPPAVPPEAATGLEPNANGGLEDPQANSGSGWPTAPAAPTEPGGVTEPAAAAAPTEPAGRRTAVVGLAVGLCVAALGALIGWLWAEYAPRVHAIRTEAGFAYADPAPEEAIGADGWFALLGVGAGVVVAVLAWTLLARYRGVGVLVGVTLGSLAAGYVAWWVGHTITAAELETLRGVAVGTEVEPPPSLRITDLDGDAWWRPMVTGVAAAQALMAALVYTLLAAFAAHPDLRGGEEEPEESAQPPWSAGAQFGPG